MLRKVVGEQLASPEPNVRQATETLDKQAMSEMDLNELFVDGAGNLILAV